MPLWNMFSADFLRSAKLSFWMYTSSYVYNARHVPADNRGGD